DVRRAGWHRSPHCVGGAALAAGAVAAQLCRHRNRGRRDRNLWHATRRSAGHRRAAMTGALLTNLAGFLLRGRNADGGWGYYSGKATRLEPTSWALLALRGLVPDAGLGQILETWPARQGLLAERPGGDPNYAFHALGLLVLRAFSREHAQSNDALIRGLQGVKGFRVDAPNTSNRQNNRLQGWSWIPATFSWVEPTAWALLALKKFRQVAGAPVDPDRLTEAETLLLDRSCVLGGWNYGNSNMFGAE